MVRFTYEFVKNEFEERGYILLDDSYKNNNTKMKYKCPIHPDKDLSITFSKLYNLGRGCSYCAGNASITTDEVKSKVEDEGYLLLSTYSNAYTKIKLRCPQNHTWECLFNNFKKGHRCKFCVKTFYTIEDIKRMFEERYYVLLTETYENSYQKMHYLCIKHKSNGTQKISVGNFLKGHGCRYCANETLSKKNKKYNIELAKEIFANNNKLLLDEEYIDCTVKMKYICNNHPNDIHEMTLSSAIQGTMCPICTIESNRGKNNYNWKGGITPLSNYTRNSISQWRIDSLIFYNYKCVITGVKSSKLEVHHLYNFSKILNETLDALNIDIRDKVNDYSIIDLQAIESLLLKKHYDYGFGVPMLPEIHKQFHSRYGRENNTKEQFEEFKQNYFLSLEGVV